MKKTLILGLGNPILGDDGVGIHVVRALPAQTLPLGVVSVEASVGGLRLLEIISGYQEIVLVDAIQTADGQPGDIYHLHPQDLRTSLHSGSAHDLSLSGALQLGRKLGMDIPEDSAIKIIAIQVKDVRTLEEKCTPMVEAAIPRAVEAVLAVLEKEST
jgi:hydrogenase maturation protease